MGWWWCKLWLCLCLCVYLRKWCVLAHWVFLTGRSALYKSHPLLLLLLLWGWGETVTLPCIWKQRLMQNLSWVTHSKVNNKVSVYCWEKSLHTWNSALTILKKRLIKLCPSNGGCSAHISYRTHPNACKNTYNKILCGDNRQRKTRNSFSPINVSLQNCHNLCLKKMLPIKCDFHTFIYTHDS